MYLHPIHFPIPSYSPSAPVPHPIKQNLRGKSGREKNKQTFFFLKSEGLGQFCFHALRVGYTIPTPPGPALLCCPGEVEGSLSGVLQPLRGRDSPYTLYDPRDSSSVCLSHWVWGMRGEGISPCPCHQMSDEKWGELSLAYNIGAGSVSLSAARSPGQLSCAS